MQVVKTVDETIDGLDWNNAYDRFELIHKKKAPSTMRSYLDIIRHFYAFIYGAEWNIDENLNPRGKKKAEIELTRLYANRYFVESRKYELDVLRYFNSLDVAPSSINGKKSVLGKYLRYNKVFEKIDPITWDSVGADAGTDALTLDKVLTHEEYRRVDRYLPLHGKVFARMSICTGMRKGELLKLLEEDIKWEYDPVRVHVPPRNTKNKRRRWAFLIPELVPLLEEWQGKKKAYIIRSNGRSGGGKSLDDPRVFPFSESVVRAMWYRALREAGLDQRDENTKSRIHVYHFHTQRKFFSANYRGREDFKNAIRGHQPYLSRVYDRYSLDDIAEDFKAGMWGLFIDTDYRSLKELEEIRVELNEKDSQFQIMQQRFVNEYDRNLSRDEEMKRLQDKLNRVELLLFKAIREVMPLDVEDIKDILSDNEDLKELLEYAGVNF